MMRPLLSLLLLTFAAALDCPSGYQIRGKCVPVGVSPLQYYIDMPDDTYRYDKTPMQTLEFPNSVAYVLNMTSQSWLTEDDFNASSVVKSVWIHQLIVVIPSNPSNASTGWLWVTGGHNSAEWSPVSKTDGDVTLAVGLAEATQTVCAVIKQVPNQPVIFKEPIPHPPDMYVNGRTEDGIIAYTWNHFMFKDLTSPEWLLRLPMTKSVVRAMDTVTDFARTKGLRVAKFVVGGASKRGWTTWTTGVVEERCAAIVPVVMDLLNMPACTQRHYQSLGGFTFEFNDYLQAGVDGLVMRSQNFTIMSTIVDAYNYFTRAGAPWPSPSFLNLPKLIVNGENDEFFLPDDSVTWWKDLPPPKSLLRIPNADHPLRFWPPGSGTGEHVFEVAVLAFYSAIVHNKPRPTFTWEFSLDGREITAANFSSPPANVTAWSSLAKDFRDWRLFTCRTGVPGNNCTYPEADPTQNITGGPEPHPIKYEPAPATLVSEGVWSTIVPVPPPGTFISFFLSATWSDGQHYTTEVSIVPMALPFPPCTGAECSRMV